MNIEKLAKSVRQIFLLLNATLVEPPQTQGTLQPVFGLVVVHVLTQAKATSAPIQSKVIEISVDVTASLFTCVQLCTKGCVTVGQEEEVDSFLPVLGRSFSLWILSVLLVRRSGFDIVVLTCQFCQIVGIES